MPYRFTIVHALCSQPFRWAVPIPRGAEPLGSGSLFAALALIIAQGIFAGIARPANAGGGPLHPQRLLHLEKSIPGFKKYVNMEALRANTEQTSATNSAVRKVGVPLKHKAITENFQQKEKVGAKAFEKSKAEIWSGLGGFSPASRPEIRVIAEILGLNKGPFRRKNLQADGSQEKLNIAREWYEQIIRAFELHEKKPVEQFVSQLYTKGRPRDDGPGIGRVKVRTLQQNLWEGPDGFSSFTVSTIRKQQEPGWPQAWLLPLSGKIIRRVVTLINGSEPETQSNESLSFNAIRFVLGDHLQSGKRPVGKNLIVTPGRYISNPDQGSGGTSGKSTGRSSAPILEFDKDRELIISL